MSEVEVKVAKTAKVLGGIRLGNRDWFELYLDDYPVIMIRDAELIFKIVEGQELTCEFIDANSPKRIIGNKFDIQEFIAGIRPRCSN